MENYPDLFEKYGNMLVDQLMTFGPKVLLALLVIWIGFKLINLINKRVDWALDRSKVDPTLRPFIHNLLEWTLKIILLISAAGIVGVETASFAVVLGSVGLAIGLAMQGTLSNFASGVMLLIFRPFKVGDYVEVAGEGGVAELVGVFVTHLRSPQNRLIIIPNSTIFNNNLVNYSDAEKVQIRLSVGVSYDADLKQARQVIIDQLTPDSRILKTDPTEVLVSELADSSVNLSVRFWVKPSDYWGTYFDSIEGVKTCLDAAQIEIPFPQRVVTMKQ
jgi:small conductance mechanosensitive channel